MIVAVSLERCGILQGVAVLCEMVLPLGISSRRDVLVHKAAYLSCRKSSWSYQGKYHVTSRVVCAVSNGFRLPIPSHDDYKPVVRGLQTGVSISLHVMTSAVSRIDQATSELVVLAADRSLNLK